MSQLHDASWLKQDNTFPSPRDLLERLHAHAHSKGGYLLRVYRESVIHSALKTDICILGCLNAREAVCTHESWLFLEVYGGAAKALFCTLRPHFERN